MSAVRRPWCRVGVLFRRSVFQVKTKKCISYFPSVFFWFGVVLVGFSVKHHAEKLQKMVGCRSLLLGVYSKAKLAKIPWRQNDK